MRLVIVSPHGGRTVEDLGSLSLWTPVGQMGILPGHADFVGEVVPGSFRAVGRAETLGGVLGSGLLRIEDGTVRVAVEQWSEEAPADLGDRIERLAAQVAAAADKPAAAQRLGRELAWLRKWAAERGRAA
jgi:F0F1-type ATP synthase epsilon subunit